VSVRIIHAPAPAQVLERVERLANAQSHLRIALTLLIVAGLAASFTSTVYLQLALDRPPYKEFAQHLLYSLAGLALIPITCKVLEGGGKAKRWLRIAIPCAFILSLILVALVRFSPLGVADFGARRWLDLGFVKFQPSELLKISIVMYLGQLLCWWRRLPVGERSLAQSGGGGTPPLRQRSDSPTFYRDRWQASIAISERVASERLSGLERLLRPSKYGLLAWLKLDERPSWPALPISCFLIILLAMGLTAIQPDLGTTGLILGVSVVTCILAGTRARDLLVLLAILIGLAGTMLIAAPGFYNYAEKRIETWLNPLANDDDTAYQITQGRGAVVVGGLFGRGFLRSEQKMNRLPLSTKDFVYPVIVEELGSIGGLTVMALFLYLAWAGLQLGLACRDPFNQTVIPALGLAIALQALVNIGTTLGTLPLSGLPLPFLSNGGTSLLVSIFSIGIMYALARAELREGDRELEQVFG
jgi:cell division protein FtsW (lipid II flippase)